MPHAEIRYSDDLTFDPLRILTRIEAVIAAHDAGAGACKGRAYPCAVYHHSHVLIEVALLTKPHRDAAFKTALLADLETAIKAEIAQPCAFSLGLRFSDPYYVTNQHDGASA